MKRALLLTFFLSAVSFLRAESDPLKSVAAQLAEGIRKQGPVTSAVLRLAHHDKHASDGPAVISDRLTGWLSAEKKITVVERDRLEQALDELHLGHTGRLDPQTVKSLGQLLGAEVIVTGTIINLPKGQSEVNARAVLSKNGRIIAAGRAIVERNWNDRRRLD